MAIEPLAGTPMTMDERRSNRLPYVEFYEDVASNWRYRIVGGNGEIVMASEPYASKSNAVRGFGDLVRVIGEVAAGA